MPTDTPLWTQADYDAFNAKQDRITANAVARARVVQAEINNLRAALSTAAPRPFRDVGNFYEDFPNAAVLASLDTEMTRLCNIPGVLSALLAEMASEAP